MSTPTTLYDKIMRIIQGPKIESSSFFGKIKAFGQTLLRTTTFEDVQNGWITGEGAAAAVELTLTDVDKAAIQGRVQLVETEYSGRGPNTVIEKKKDAVGAYIIEKLISENPDDVNSMSEETKQKLINSAKRDSKIKETLANKFGYQIVGGRRTKKSKNTRKATKTRKANNKRRSQRNKRRSQRNRK